MHRQSINFLIPTSRSTSNTCRRCWWRLPAWKVFPCQREIWIKILVQVSTNLEAFMSIIQDNFQNKEESILSSISWKVDNEMKELDILGLRWLRFSDDFCLCLRHTIVKINVIFYILETWFLKIDRSISNYYLINRLKDFTYTKDYLFMKMI